MQLSLIAMVDLSQNQHNKKTIIEIKMKLFPSNKFFTQQATAFFNKY